MQEGSRFWGFCYGREKSLIGELHKTGLTFGAILEWGNSVIWPSYNSTYSSIHGTKHLV